MNSLIRIGILWCLAISIGRAQEAAKFQEASQAPTLETEEPSPLPASEVRPVNGQPSPIQPEKSEPPRRVTESKRIVIQPGVDAQESEVAMQFMADLEKAGIAKIDKTEMTPTSDSPIVVQVFMRENESFEKIKQFIVVLRHSGLEHMVLEYGGGIHPEGRGEPENGLVFRTILGFSPDELQGLEKAARKAAEDCGLSLHFAGTVVAPSEPAASGPPDKKPDVRDAQGYATGPGSPQPVTRSVLPSSKAIVLVIDADAQKSEVVKQVVEVLEKAGVATSLPTEPAPSPEIVVALLIRKDESSEKIKTLIAALTAVGVRQISLRTAVETQVPETSVLILTAQPGYTIEALQRIEGAARTAANQCGLTLGTAVKGLKVTANGELAFQTSDDIAESDDANIAAMKMKEETSDVIKINGGPAAEIAPVLAQTLEKMLKHPVRLYADAESNSILVPHNYRLTENVMVLAERYIKFRYSGSANHGGKDSTEPRFPSPVADADLQAESTAKLLDTRQSTTDQLRSNYSVANQQAHNLAESLRQTPDAAKKAELRTAVQRAFTLRQSLLRAELQEMQARLEKTQQSLDMRDRIADQIVDRRVEDLLNPQLEWDGDIVPGRSLTQSVSPNGPAINVPTPVDPKAGLLAKLQGAWDVKQIFEAEENGELTTVSLKALVDGNRISLSGIDGSNPATFDLQLGAAGPPQQVDLKPVLTKAELEDLQMNEVPNLNVTFPGIIEITDDGIRICLDDSHLDQRPIVFAAGPATGLWELRRGVAVSVPITKTELEGDWHLVSAIDSLGKAVEIPPYNVSFRNYQFTIEYLGGEFARGVKVYPNSKRINFMDHRGFIADNYHLEGDQLTLYGDGVTMVYQRGHVELSKSIPDATEEQRSRWRSGIVEILTQQSTDTSQKPKRIGHGVIVSPRTLIVGQVRPFDGDCSFVAKFDDGTMVPIRILEQGPQGFFTFEPLQPMEAKVHFRFSNETVEQHDEVHLWAQPAVFSELQPLELFKTTVSTLDHNSFAFGLMVWRLNLNIELDGSLPILDSNGDLLAITIAGTNDLLLAVPVSQLKMMFPKSFGPAAQVAE